MKECVCVHIRENNTTISIDPYQQDIFLSEMRKLQSDMYM